MGDSTHSAFVFRTHHTDYAPPHFSRAYLLQMCIYCFEREELSCRIQEYYMHMIHGLREVGVNEDPITMHLEMLKRKFDSVIEDVDEDEVELLTFPVGHFTKKKLVWFVNRGYNFYMKRVKKIDCAVINGDIKIEVERPRFISLRKI